VCQALGLPRASFIGLVEGAPHAGSLVDVIRRSVPEIEVPWLEEVKKSTYLPVKINAIKTFASVPKKQPR
jgi:ribonuclease P/MRP protein subunit POP3